MQSLNKYLLLGLVAISAILLIYCLSLKNSRDNAINKLDKANEQLNSLISTNSDLKNTISKLNEQAELNNKYVRELDKKRKDSEAKANELSDSFKKAKRTNPTINSWSNQPLPNGLY